MESHADEAAHEARNREDRAPHDAVRRLDEVGAARKPILRWKPATPRSEAAD